MTQAPERIWTGSHAGKYECCFADRTEAEGEFGDAVEGYVHESLAAQAKWQPISMAPKARAKGERWYGPRILISTTHHGGQFVFIGRFHHGIHKRFLDEVEVSCLSAGDEGDMWMPLPAPPTEGK